jgi:hypothetical protein
MTCEQPYLRIAAIGLVVGSVAVFGFRAAHGDVPAYNPALALPFIAAHPAYASIHLGADIGVLIWLGGLVGLTSSLTEQSAGAFGRLGLACALVGSAVYIVDFSIDGLAGQTLARAWLGAAPAEQARLELSAATLLTALLATSLISIAILWGPTLVLFGLAVTRQGYPSWVGWSGVIIGAATFLAATTQYLRPGLMPGVWIYGGLGSIVQIWSALLAIVVWRRPVRAGRRTCGPAMYSGSGAIGGAIR